MIPRIQVLSLNGVVLVEDPLLEILGSKFNIKLREHFSRMPILWLSGPTFGMFPKLLYMSLLTCLEFC